jgi:hypothetical protein
MYIMKRLIIHFSLALLNLLHFWLKYSFNTMAMNTPSQYFL